MCVASLDDNGFNQP